MKTIRTCVALALMTAATVLVSTETASAQKDERLFEMRIYYAAPGKLDDLNARFRNHTCKLFEKHGMVNIGYWVPMENTENKLVYILAFPSKEAREASWKAFGADPAWKEVVKASEANGRLVTKADSIQMKATDFTALVKPTIENPNRVFELRTYKSTAANLSHLLARFRNHTVKLFEKYGMTNVGYWVPTEKAKGSEDTLIYLLAHKSKDAAAESFKNFRADPAWIKARADSEKDAGGPLTITNGVKSEFMAPTDYSQMK